MAQGVTAIEMTATSTTIGREKRSTGAIQRSRLRPPALNQTGISLSCQLRIITISTAMNIDRASRAGRLVNDE